ncbi:unnamed protein product [Calypogeia fissa]
MDEMEVVTEKDPANLHPTILGVVASQAEKIKSPRILLILAIIDAMAEVICFLGLLRNQGKETRARDVRALLFIFAQGGSVVAFRLLSRSDLK